MKLVLVDNFARETVADRLLAVVDMTEADAQKWADAWNAANCRSDYSDRFCVVKPDNRRLWGGMSEFV